MKAEKQEKILLKTTDGQNISVSPKFLTCCTKAGNFQPKFFPNFSKKPINQTTLQSMLKQKWQ